MTMIHTTLFNRRAGERRKKEEDILKDAKESYKKIAAYLKK